MRAPDAPSGWLRSRRMRRIAAATLGCALASTAAVGTASTATAASGTTLTVAMDSSGVDTLNPFLAYFNGALNTFGMVYPSLNSLDREGKPGPYLAKSWETSSDQLTWTFKLQDGLKWTDGQPITAEDAAWTFNLIMTNNDAAKANGSLVANFDSVSAPDPTTLVIKTKQPQANMLYVSIPVSGIPIVPKHIWESHVADLKDYKNDSYPVVGYGPWTLTNYTTDQFEKFTANKSFKLGDVGAPKYDNLVVQVFKNSDAAVAALKSNQISFLSGLNTNQYNALKGDSKLQAVQEAGNGWTAVEINSGAKTRSGKPMGTANPLLADDKIRTAINYAIDKDKLVSNVLGGLGQVGNGYLPPAYPQWTWKPSADEAVSYDPAKANSLLDAAGYTKGGDGIRVDSKTGKPLSFRLGIHSDNSRDTQISQFLKGWLQAIGINLDIQSLSMSKLNDDLSKGDWDILMDGWTTGPDPTYLLSIQTCGTLPLDDGSGGNTDAFYCNPDFDKLFAQQVATFDPNQRAQIIGQMQDMLYKANNDIILYYANGLDAVRKGSVSNLISGKPDGNGLYPVQSVFWNYLDATPAAGDNTSSESHTTLYVVLGVVVVLVVVGGVFALRRRSTAGDRE
ncbi:ABC transporter substrate-binding protein [Planosporangium thailandense]|uniref:ABC transporter substrate-binding protein n=1 Tax=Planosporangium thailandense TaxID=765197 RepID=A0ABX0Y9Y7_9ACTN|nr:ABC transporter substrate-binding protein [Planosporangium thailandense]NJC74059.1 ABC transporter substrate-binding protein [Planosporangium thailandense]